MGAHTTKPFFSAGFLNAATVDTRNYLTHRDAKLSSAAWDGAELAGAVFRLRRLLSLLLLKTTGAKAKTISAVVSQHRAYRTLEGLLNI